MGIGKRIKEARENKGMTQAELGKKVGTTGSSITNYEKETSHPKEEILYRLIEALSVDANFLFQDVVHIPSEQNNVTLSEYKHLEKYRKLDAHGKEMVDFTLEKEYERSISLIEERAQRVNNDYLMPVAAHNDNADDPEQQRLMEEDLADL